jgi:S-adenosylmethionine:tRNA ribosyltransferase-isomerase
VSIAAASARLVFDVPDALQASSPPEARGLARDEIRMLVAGPEGLDHRTLDDLPLVLDPGDLIVLNTSSTIPASLAATTESGDVVRVNLSTVAPDTGMTPAQALAGRASTWFVEFRTPAGPADPPNGDDAEMAVFGLPGAGTLRLDPPPSGGGGSARLWQAQLETPQPLITWLGRHAQPIRYSYVTESWPIEAYRNSYSTIPGSVEMPSAGRGLTPRLLARLAARGVQVVPVTLHCGVSSQEAGEAPYVEWCSVSAGTAGAVNAARRSGRRVLAVGTTVVRALETAAVDGGFLTAAEGWTDLVVGPHREIRTIDGLLTGWHEPRASHLMMLESLVGRDLLGQSYRAALQAGYLWHEFGDVHLLLR